MTAHRSIGWRPRREGVGRACLAAATRGPTLGVLFACLVLGSAPAATQAAPAANIDQIRNGAADDPNNPGQWVNGNAGPENAHYMEKWSIAYRVRLTDMASVVGTEIQLVLGFDITHSGTHALDYLTSVDRLNPAGGPPHLFLSHSAPEVLDPTEGTPFDDGNPATVPAAHDAEAIDCPTTCVDPDGAGGLGGCQPTDSCLALPAVEKQMRIWGGTISDVSYPSTTTCGENSTPAQGTLSASQSEARIVVRFTPSASTVVLAWGGHIASRDEWGFDDDGDPQSAGGISGSPYHMRLLSWCGHPALGNLGNQDRSLKAAAVLVPPDCAVTCGDQSVCEGGTGRCSAVGSSGTAPYTIEWRNSSGALVTSCTGVNENGSCPISVTRADTYCATVIDDIGLASDDGCCFTLSTNPNPTCSVEPALREVCAGQSAEFCLTGSGGTGPYTFRWDTGETTRCITRSTAGTYCGFVTDANGCVSDRCCGQLVVNPNPSCSISPPRAEVCQGTSQEFCVNPTGGTGPYTFRWNTGETSRCVTKSTAGRYCAVVTDSEGCVSQECCADLIVNPNPSANPSGAEECVDAADPAIHANGSGGTPPYTCSWSPTAFLSNANSCDPTFDLSAAGAGTYQRCVTVTDSKGCNDRECTNVTVNPVPACADGFDFSVPLQFTGTISGGTAPYASCSAQVVNGSGWSVGACTINGSAFRVTYSVTQPASETVTFRVTVVDANGCDDSCEDAFAPLRGCIVEPLAAEVCDGSSATFCASPNIGMAPFTGEWVGPSGATVRTCSNVALLGQCCITVDDAGTYSVAITDALGFRSVECEATLDVNPNPDCNVSPPNAAVCEGDSQQFCARPTGGTAPYNVEWRNSAGTLLGNCSGVQAGGECCFNTSIAGTYTASVVDAAGCEGDCPATLTVDNCACRMTGGGNDTSSPWPWDQTYGQGKSRGINGLAEDRYTFGGQAGAPTANQPQPFGEWTHVNHQGPDGKFTFHAGTASAPDETEIDRIRCCDRTNCNPARHAPNKQVDFQGRGVFKNMSGNVPFRQYVDVGDSIHWFEVNVDDLGEPGNKAESGADCPANGFECGDDPGGFEKCDCADYYRIKIYSKPDAPSVDPTSIVIYAVQGYITGGNFQVHPPID